MNAPADQTSPRRTARGFTLAELMMATVVMALAITTSITTLQRGFADLDSARNIETATRILQCEMEKERLMTWAQVSVTNLVPTIDSTFLAIPSVAGRFALARKVTTVANRSGNMLQITLENAMLPQEADLFKAMERLLKY